MFGMEIAGFAVGALCSAAILCSYLAWAQLRTRRRPSQTGEPLLSAEFDVFPAKEPEPAADQPLEIVEASGDWTGFREQVGVDDVLTQIVTANDELRERLNKAETALESQAQEIFCYMSEARTDTLTGLPNRRVFDDALTRCLKEFARDGRPVSVIMVDVDHFKRFNDTYGHLAGDAVLVQVAQVLQSAMRETDLVVRLGGEEFSIILPNCEYEDARVAAERARQAIEDSVCRYESQELKITVSCGAAQARAHEPPSSLVKRTDEALYASKSAGRNFVHWHDGELCLPVSIPRAPNLSSGNEQQFGIVCDSLRARLLEVLAEDRQAEAEQHA